MTVSPGHRPIVVGVAPEPERRSALTWAADEAARRRLPLLLLHAQGVPTAGYRPDQVPPSWEQWNAALHTAGEQLLAEAVAFAESRQPDVKVSALLAEGDPVWVLREQAQDAALVVLGSRHPATAQDLFHSASVTLPVVAQARCPVAVVPESAATGQTQKHWVVGVDGSTHSAAAVDFAFDEASLHGVGLHAVYAWHPGLLGGPNRSAAEEEARQALTRAVEGPAAGHPDVDLRQEVVRGHPVQALTDASADCRGLVVGSRGLGGFTGMLMGSVSQGVLHHARSPVVVVPHPDGGSGDETSRHQRSRGRADGTVAEEAV
ncbi:universal stress protein [Streptomyces sp. NPDC088354]|uniref:universal stress protein n=1 Tax=unclassified Streptomyces TaxID=2593676 RepID=UPI0029ABAB2F|nr:universal stress protein [Streptomyces sp. MI02-7b]MDX3077796.1 universal stress protein [Streptomyces sp. MI02-7b]